MCRALSVLVLLPYCVCLFSTMYVSICIVGDGCVDVMWCSVHVSTVAMLVIGYLLLLIKRFRIGIIIHCSVI